MKGSIRKAKPEHEVLYQELTALLNRHAGKITAIEILAIAANMVGKLIALQDQRTTTPEVAMEVVIQNLQSGNQQVLDQLSKTQGHA
jgi:hypothetical protein